MSSSILRTIPIGRLTRSSCLTISPLAALKNHIEKKYVQGVWLSADDRALYFDEPRGIAL